MPYDGMKIEDMRPGMIFVDAARTDRRIVVLKVYGRRMEVWVCTVGGVGPRRSGISKFYWGPLTPHKKVRRSGAWLDTSIPGNSPDDWRAVSLD